MTPLNNDLSQPTGGPFSRCGKAIKQRKPMATRTTPRVVEINDSKCDKISLFGGTYVPHGTYCVI